MNGLQNLTTCARHGLVSNIVKSNFAVPQNTVAHTQALSQSMDYSVIAVNQD